MHWKPSLRAQESTGILLSCFFMVHTKCHTYGLNDTLEPPQSVAIWCLLSLDWSHNTGNIMVIGNSGSGVTTKPRSHFSADGALGPTNHESFIGVVRAPLGLHMSSCAQCLACSRRNVHPTKVSIHDIHLGFIGEKRMAAARACLPLWI